MSAFCASPGPFPTTPMPLLTIMRPRSQAQLLWMGSEFDAVPEHVPDWNRHLRLAREMLDTQAHGLKPHTHPVHSPARPADPQIPLTSPLLCRVQGELWRGRPGKMSFFWASPPTSCSAASSSCE